MSEVLYVLAAFFLPLFPFSMVFNRLLDRLRQPALRGLLLLIWPQIGLALLQATQAPVPAWIIPWALLSSALYAFRALVLREVGLWSGFLATSAWALLWMAAYPTLDYPTAALYALGFSAPLALLNLLAAGLERRFGAAYTGLYGGLAETLPRFAGVLVVVVLAVVATPVFPAFFALLAMIVQAIPAMPGAALGVIFIWLLWTWAGARLLQGLVVGPAGDTDIRDLDTASTWAFAAALALLAVGGTYLIGDLP